MVIVTPILSDPAFLQRTATVVETQLSSWKDEYEDIDPGELRDQATQFVSRASIGDSHDDVAQAATDLPSEAPLEEGTPLERAANQRIQLLVKHFVEGRLGEASREDERRLMLVEEKIERLLAAAKADQYEALADMLLRSNERRSELASLRRRANLD